MSPAVLVLDNPIQNYAWGSRTAIAELLGRPTPSPEPEAELWIGAHPKAPSRIAEPRGRGTLDRAIQDDPVALLGSEVCDRFGNELPFLFKVLAAGEPLSIQAHPNQEQARGGWARENAEGIPLDAPRRNYRDMNHKPELVCALTAFTALKGFRPFDDVANGLRPIARPELGAETDRLAREATPPGAARALRAPDDARGRRAHAAPEARRRRSRAQARGRGLALGQAASRRASRRRLGARAALLEPRDARRRARECTSPAGELHAYLEGTALEIMANSDNVLRGGLTPKHVDVQELMAVLLFDAPPLEVLVPEPESAGASSFKTPAREFELGFVELTKSRPFTPRRRPRRRDPAPARRRQPAREPGLGRHAQARLQRARAGGRPVVRAPGRRPHRARPRPRLMPPLVTPRRILAARVIAIVVDLAQFALLPVDAHAAQQRDRRGDGPADDLARRLALGVPADVPRGARAVRGPRADLDARGDVRDARRGRPPAAPTPRAPEPAPASAAVALTFDQAREASGS